MILKSSAHQWILSLVIDPTPLVLLDTNTGWMPTSTYHPLENSYVDSEAKTFDSNFGSLYFIKATVTGRSYSWDTWAINFEMVSPSLVWHYSIGLTFVWFTFGHFPGPQYFRPRMINITRCLNKFLPRCLDKFLPNTSNQIVIFDRTTLLIKILFKLCIFI